MNEREKNITSTLWMIMLREGGRWKPKELVDAVPPAGPAVIHASGTLQAMARAGQCIAFPVVGVTLKNTYGVTLGCKVPNGITLRDLVDAGAMRQELAQ